MLISTHLQLLTETGLVYMFRISKAELCAISNAKTQAWEEVGTPLRRIFGWPREGSGKPLGNSEKNSRLPCILDAFLWRCFGRVPLGRGPRAVPELTGGMVYLLWYGDALRSPKRS